MFGIRKFEKALRCLQEESRKSDIKIQHIQILIKLTLAQPDFVSYQDIQKHLDMTKASVSRNMKLLGKLMKKEQGQWVDKGLGLVKVQMNPYNTRELIATLSDRGKTVMKKVNDVLNH